VRDTKFRAWVVAFLATLLTCTAGAAGLGRMAVLTSIGQPLVAEIELSVTREELGSLSARLGLPDAYQRANLQYNPALTGARLTLETRSGGQPYLKLVTTRPVSEPFIDVLVELTWSSGRLSREYTALLDPPGIPPAVRPAAPVLSSLPELTPAPTPAPAATPAPAPSPQPPAAATTEPQPRPEPPVASVSEPAPAPAPAAAPEAVAAAPAISAPVTAAPAPAALAIGKEYGPIERGETLGKIARSTMPEGVTLEQMLVALYRKNEDAFIRKNLNLVRTGKILRVPDRDEVLAIAQGEAVSEFRTHVADWNAYRQKVADAAGTVPVEGRTAVSGKIAAKAEDKAGSAGPRDVVKVSQGEPPGAAAGKGKPRASADRIRSLEEDLLARERALAEANDRISQLEKTVKDMQRLIELKGGPGTAASAPKPEAKPAPKPEAVAKAEPVKPAPAKPEPAKPEIAAKPAPAPAPTPEKPIAAAPEMKKPESVAAAPSPTPPPAPKKAAFPQPKPEPGLVDQIMAEPLYLGAGGGALVLGGLAFWMARRRRSRAAEGDSPPIAPTLSTAAAAAAGAAAASGDTAAASAPDSPAAAEDDVDPLAEADVYIQYGRDSQAEEILKEALSRNPNRGDVQLKLLEIYASRKDKDSFGKLATDYHRVSGGAGDGWIKAAGMGYSIDPGNSLYEAGKDAAATVIPPTGSSTDVDLDLGGGTGTSTDITLDAGTAAAPGTDTGILDLGAVDTAQKDGEQAGTPLPDFTLEVPEAGSSAPDVALDAAPAASSAAAAAPESNVIDFQIELPKIDSGPSTIVKPAPAQAAADPGLDFKLEIPDLDLGDKGHDKTQIIAAAPVAAGGEKDGHWYDVQTKFDLAKAYQEMGDKDGAREILQEVIKEGDGEQKVQAKSLLDSLG
jgi:pilus assembly protein FimV